MGDTRSLALNTSAPLETFVEPFGPEYVTAPGGQQIESHLGDQQVTLRHPAGPYQWAGLDGRTADVRIGIDSQLSSASEEDRSRLQAEMLSWFVVHPDIEAGTYEDLEHSCFLSWTRDRVTINSNPYNQTLDLYRELKLRLGSVGIHYELRDLGLHVKPKGHFVIEQKERPYRSPLWTTEHHSAERYVAAMELLSDQLELPHGISNPSYEVFSIDLDRFAQLTLTAMRFQGDAPPDTSPEQGALVRSLALLLASGVKVEPQDEAEGRLLSEARSLPDFGD